VSRNAGNAFRTTDSGSRGGPLRQPAADTRHPCATVQHTHTGRSTQRFSPPDRPAVLLTICLSETGGERRSLRRELPFTRHPGAGPRPTRAAGTIGVRLRIFGKVPSSPHFFLPPAQTLAKKPLTIENTYTYVGGGRAGFSTPGRTPFAQRASPHGPARAGAGAGADAAWRPLPGPQRGSAKRMRSAVARGTVRLSPHMRWFVFAARRRAASNRASVSTVVRGKQKVAPSSWASGPVSASLSMRTTAAGESGSSKQSHLSSVLRD
jgi:hypothetical protein